MILKKCILARPGKTPLDHSGNLSHRFVPYPIPSFLPFIWNLFLNLLVQIHRNFSGCPGTSNPNTNGQIYLTLVTLRIREKVDFDRSRAFLDPGKLLRESQNVFQTSRSTDKLLALNVRRFWPSLTWTYSGEVVIFESKIICLLIKRAVNYRFMSALSQPFQMWVGEATRFPVCTFASCFYFQYSFGHLIPIQSTPMLMTPIPTCIFPATLSTPKLALIMTIVQSMHNLISITNISSWRFHNHVTFTSPRNNYLYFSKITENA